MKRVLGIDSSYDEVTTKAASVRTTQVYAYLRKKSLTVTRLKGKRAKRATVASEATKDDVVYITGVGHGELDCYLGDQAAPLFLVGSYSSQEATPKIVHLLSCLTARQLGPDLVSNGARAFFGYDDYFAFDPGRPAEFIECDSEIDRGFADGLSAREVYQRTVELFNAKIDKATQDGEFYLAGTLEKNLSHLCSPSSHQQFGSEDAHL